MTRRVGIWGLVAATMIAASGSANPPAAHGATWFARLYPDNPDYVEITVDTRDEPANAVFRRLVGHVAIQSPSGTVWKDYAFIDGTLTAVAGGSLIVRYFAHGVPSAQSATPGGMDSDQDVGGGKADSNWKPAFSTSGTLPQGNGKLEGPRPGAVHYAKPVRKAPMHDGAYRMVHDGWRGVLVLKGGGGTYTAAGGRIYQVRVRADGYHVTFYVLGLGGQNADSSGGQKFDGYVMTQTRDAIAGLTWWGKRPFGFYAVRIR